MIHLETRCPESIQIEVVPSPIAGFIAKAVDTQTGAKVEAWGRTDVDAKFRAEYLVALEAS